jgi:diguanylate cyclase (GGDEF)-like protein
MDPTTVILILALNLLAIGGLLAMIGRRMDDAQGMRGFATGSMVFGLAYLLRLALGHQATSLASVLPDVAMFYATLCYATGLRQFSGQGPLGRRFISGCALAFGLLSLACTLVWQDVGRHAVLNGGLALNYGVLCVLAALAARRLGGTLQLPLLVLAVFIGLLAVLTSARFVVAMVWGVAPLFSGLPAQVYYAFSTIVSVVMGPNLLWMVFMRLNDRLSQLATHDPLTGLLNRNGLDEALQRHFGQRPPRALVLCQLDIDHFKQVNDVHGHAAGDAVLRGVARTLAAQVRGGDFVARLGGEEFLVGCSGADHAQAMALAERLRAAVASQHHLLGAGQDLACTVSIGVSPVFHERGAWEAALRDADAALYQAKQAGRNRVVAAADAGPDGAPSALA